MRRFFLLIALLSVGFSTLARGAAETYKLANGATVSGEMLTATANDQGVKIKTGEGEYQTVPWASFAQEDIKNFAKNPKLLPFVEPFVEVTQEERMKKTQPELKQPPRLELPAKQGLFAALLGSGPGVLILLLIYAANIYAAYEISIFRARPALLVCGLAAIPGLGILASILFLSLRTDVKGSAAPVEEPAPEAVAAAAAAEDGGNPMQGSAEHPAGLHLAHAEEPKEAAPKITKFQRGQFTFNRRFFETKFPAFFGVIRRDADKHLELTIKSARGTYQCERITRIASSDVHIQVQHGQASEEVMIPFTDIQEIQLKE